MAIPPNVPVGPGCENRVLRTSRLSKTGTYGAKSALQVHVAPGPAITPPTTQRACRTLQVHHKGGPVRDASSKGAWKAPTSTPVYLRHVHLPDARLTTHARKRQEAHLRAPASLRLDPPCPRRALIDQNIRAWRTWSLLWGTKMRKRS